MTEVSDDEQVTLEYELDAPVEKVWRALTVPEFVAAWLMPGDVSATEGHTFSLSGTAPDEPARVECTVEESRPNQVLRYSWREDGAEESIVSFELEAGQEGRTILRLMHGPVQAARKLVAANGNAPPLMMRAA